ncbi:MAG: MgtC/SapB family protein [Erysipelotrichaceae bacterium]
MIELLNFDLMSNLELILKFALAIITGVIIGAERVKKRRPAGIKTHAQVCLGATLVMITGEYIYLVYGGMGDVARMGAQVISGVGFLGVGTIIVTGRNKVSGLTTAAGLWFSACVGLTIGIGYYSAAVMAILMTMVVRVLLGKMDKFYKNHSYIGDFKIILEDSTYFVGLLVAIKKKHGIVSNIYDAKDNDRIVTLTISFEDSLNHQRFTEELLKVEGVLMVDEI